MGIFKLTSAEDEIEKKSQDYQNLQAILGAMLIAVTLTLASGFWYLLVPHDINWNASQSIMVLHLVGGLCALLLLIAFFFLHQKDKKLVWWQFLLPWTIKHKDSDNQQHWHQRLLGALLTWLFIAIFATGIAIALPALFFQLDMVWLHGYYRQQWLNFAHQWFSVALVPIFFIHMLWQVRKH